MFLDTLRADAALARAHLHSAIVGQDQLAEAMRYATNGGKGLRAFLVCESARLHGVVQERYVGPAAAIEAMHAYSLVHDDMPCMDDDDLRRGQPTVHRKWDDATAVLVGDALQALAFELVSHPSCGSAKVRTDLALNLARAAGAQGMVRGQALDMAAETAADPLTLEEITILQAGKTGALIEWSAMAGAVLAGADTAPLRAYAQALGLAFQIADDLLDVEATLEQTGKATGKDAMAGKATFVSLLGVDGAKRRAAALVESAEDALAEYGEGAHSLREAARFVISRDS